MRLSFVFLLFSILLGGSGCRSSRSAEQQTVTMDVQRLTSAGVQWHASDVTRDSLAGWLSQQKWTEVDLTILAPPDSTGRQAVAAKATIRQSQQQTAGHQRLVEQSATTDSTAQQNVIEQSNSRQETAVERERTAPFPWKLLTAVVALALFLIILIKVKSCLR